MAGKSAMHTVLARDEWILRVKRSGDDRGQENPLGSVAVTVPQTDTGRGVEDTKARESTPVKELGKITP